MSPGAEGKTKLAVFVRDWGQAVLIACAIGGGAITFTTKAWGWFNAGPVALSKAEKTEKDVRRLKRQNRFMIRGMEKLTREKYDWRGEDSAIEREDEQ